ncbi:hypothetical protein N7509_003666 [Penicillium cosmopolitanum]|uniref:Uncharacterized protein n=1 Tax=Penicillium cosmopolitanum TaxID=1131564 RepID=A0A9X0BBK9_9EURO|nr:uncharacterized protein N7509_003666 [Penicillium cosmopolitanum]KAJ5403795.1 hypothetical protein N7509_003666 [Penicillium cosmopolitanum]
MNHPHSAQSGFDWIEARLKPLRFDIQSIRNQLDHNFKILQAEIAAVRKMTPPPIKYTIPDPAAFSDGKEPDFETWKLKIENKLQASSDQLYTPQLRMAYVFSRCEGPAAQQLAPRMRPGATLRFKDATDMIARLEKIYGDPWRAIHASRQYHALSMDCSMKFIDFFPTFCLLAENARIPEEERKEDLFKKLSVDYREQLIDNLYGQDFNELVDECKRLDYYIFSDPD